ncbi:MAG: 30S ribosomal protein S17 [Polyangiaceae bacterium]|jgi:small subunit ribosomal protein S17
MSQNAPVADAQDAAAPHEHDAGHGFRRTMTGRVISAKMQKTVVVEVVTHRRDPLYGKYVRSRARYKAHDEKGEVKAGDEVEIQEHRPISRGKRWRVIRIAKKYVEE